MMFVGTVTDREWEVTVEGRPLPLRLDLRDHSPTGFAWGYSGSGPSQLALAMLAYVVGDELAEALYFEFRNNVIASMDQNRGWILESDQIVDWVARKRIEKGI
jgi:hypothetical protein